MTTTTQRNWRAIVEAVDENFLKEALRPVAYRFSNGREFRDYPGSGPYAKPETPEETP